MTVAIAASPSAATAKLWFWLVISIFPVARSCTGWLAPWWPNGSLTVVPPSAVGEQLMAEADAEHRDRRAEQLGDDVGGLGDAGRIAWSIGQEDAVGFAGQHVVGGGRRRHDVDRPQRGEVAQDRAFDAVVVGDDVAPRAVDSGHRVRLGRRDGGDEVDPVGARLAAAAAAHRVEVLCRTEGTGDCAGRADQAGEAAGVDAGDPGDAVAPSSASRSPSARRLECLRARSRTTTPLQNSPRDSKSAALTP